MTALHILTHVLVAQVRRQSQNVATPKLASFCRTYSSANTRERLLSNGSLLSNSQLPIINQTFCFAHVATDCSRILGQANVSQYAILSSGHMLGTTCYTHHIYHPAATNTNAAGNSSSIHNVHMHRRQKNHFAHSKTVHQQCIAGRQNNIKRQRIADYMNSLRCVHMQNIFKCE